jgi:hypothetical protein
MMDTCRLEAEKCGEEMGRIRVKMKMKREREREQSLSLSLSLSLVAIADAECRRGVSPIRIQGLGSFSNKITCRVKPK